MSNQPPPASGVTVQAEPEAPAPAPAAKPLTELGAFGVELAARDLNTKPGDDFYQYAGGSWIANYQLAADEPRFGSFIKLMYRAEERVRALVEELQKKSWPAGSDEQKIVDYYASYMDVAAANAQGTAPIRAGLNSIAAIKTFDGLVQALGRAGLEGTNAPLDFMPEIDLKNPDRYLVYVSQGGLGMPDRSYYLEPQFEEVRKAYEPHIAQVLKLAGTEESAAAAAATKVLALETEIAKHHLSRAELRDREKLYNPHSLKEVEALFSGYPVRAHLKAAELDPTKLETLIVTAPKPLAELAKLVKATPIDTWKSYLSYHLVLSHAQVLGDSIDNAVFDFMKKRLAGQAEQRARWKRGVQLVGSADMHDGLSSAVGKLYVAEHFPPESKQKIDALVGNLRAALRERLEQLDWMGPETRQQALAKLDAFNPKIGYPTVWPDLSSLEIKPGDLAGNFQAVRRFWYRDKIQRLGKATDRAEWFMAPHAINAYYNPSFNEIVFPAGILEPPFFDPNADLAVNYGAIGAVIGHEMGHGFDDQGSKVDAKGVQRNWWTDADRAAFEERTTRLVAQYNAIEAVKGVNVNGQLTLGENIGDLGGISMAYHAYKRALAGATLPVLDGLTGDQRFFLAWAQVWRSKQRDEMSMMLAKIDPHSPAKARVNGVVRNLAAWHEAFNVQPGSALYLPPEQRVSIW